jgi:hypothetical protein
MTVVTTCEIVIKPIYESERRLQWHNTPQYQTSVSNECSNVSSSLRKSANGFSLICKWKEVNGLVNILVYLSSATLYLFPSWNREANRPNEIHGRVSGSFILYSEGSTLKFQPEDVNFNWDFRCFLQFLQEISRIVPQINLENLFPLRTLDDGKQHFV